MEKTHKDYSLYKDMDRLIDLPLKVAINTAKTLIDETPKNSEFFSTETVEAVNDATALGDLQKFKPSIIKYLEAKKEIQPNFENPLDLVHFSKIIDVNARYIKKYAAEQENYDFNYVQRQIFGEAMEHPNTPANILFNKMGVTSMGLFQKVNDPHVDFVKKKEFLTHWDLIPYNKDEVEQLTSEKLLSL